MVCLHALVSACWETGCKVRQLTQSDNRPIVQTTTKPTKAALYLNYYLIRDIGGRVQKKYLMSLCVVGLKQEP